MITRTDLPIGVIAAQIAHAAGESSPGDLPEGTYAIVLGVPDETALRGVLARLTLSQLAWRAIYEPDWDNQLMAIGVAPVLRSIGRKTLSCLPLFRGSTFVEVAQVRAPEREDAGSNPALDANHAGVAQSRALEREVDGSRPSSRTNSAGVAQERVLAREDAGLNPAPGTNSAEIAQSRAPVSKQEDAGSRPALGTTLRGEMV